MAAAEAAATAMVPYEAPIACVACGKSSAEESNWGQYVASYNNTGQLVRRRPAGDACGQCKDTAWIVWGTKAAENLRGLKNNERDRASFMEWTARRLGLREPSFNRQGINDVLTIGTRWEQGCVPLDITTFQAKFGRQPKHVPGVRVETVRNANGFPTEVVLVGDGQPPRLVMYCQGESQLHEHHLLSSNHVNKAQAQEAWQKVMDKVLKSRPTATPPTMQELAAMTGTPMPEAGGSFGITGGPAGSRAASHATSSTPVISTTPQLNSSSSSPDALREVLEDGGEMDDVPEERPAQELLAIDDGPTPMPETKPKRRLSTKCSDPSILERPSKRGRKSGAGNSPGTAVEFTVYNVLAGLHVKPTAKTLLYHRRLQLTALKKTADAMKIMAEEARLTSLGAAERLQPSEVSKISDQDLRDIMPAVLREVPASCLPRVTMLGLTRRSALHAIQGFRAKQLLECCWPWSNLARQFDPMEARLCDTPDWSDFLVTDKVQWATDLLLRDGVAVWLKYHGEQALTCLIALASMLQDLMQGRLAPSQVAPPEDAPDTSKQLLKDVMSTLLAITAAIQTTPCTADQLDALASLSANKVGAAQDLAALLEEPWWAERLSVVWRTAAAESQAHPMLSRIAHVFKSEATMASKATEDAWNLLQTRTTRWAQDLRQGAMRDLFVALRKHVQGTLESALAVPTAERQKPWLDSTEKLRSRLSWLQGILADGHLAASQVGTEAEVTAWQINLTSQLEAVSSALQHGTANFRLNKGLQLASNLSGDADLSVGLEQQLMEAFAECQGLSIPPAAYQPIHKVLLALEGSSSDCTIGRAKLALALLELLQSSASANLSALADSQAAPAPSDSDLMPGADVLRESQNRWNKTLLGLQLVELSETKPDGQVKLEERLRIDKLVSEFASCTMDVFGGRGSECQEACDDIQTWLSEMRQQLIDMAEDDAKEAATALEDRAGGAPHGESWKGSLPEDCNWETLQRDGAYHLLPATETKYWITIEPLCEKAVSAMQLLMRLCDEANTETPSETYQRLEAAVKLARATATEAYLLDLFLSDRTSRRGTKCQQRIASMAKHGMSEDMVHPLLMSRAKEAAAAGSRASL